MNIKKKHLVALAASITFHICLLIVWNIFNSNYYFTLKQKQGFFNQRDFKDRRKIIISTFKVKKDINKKNFKKTVPRQKNDYKDNILPTKPDEHSSTIETIPAYKENIITNITAPDEQQANQKEILTNYFAEIGKTIEYQLNKEKSILKLSSPISIKLNIIISKTGELTSINIVKTSNNVIDDKIIEIIKKVRNFQAFPIGINYPNLNIVIPITIYR
ncbi:MAG: hypothetical protein HQK49_20765 [Oligoflexia bacterium]|nr:hypothetical protein [Oligoflexia bacterium]